MRIRQVLLNLIVIISALNLSSCVRIYVASPDLLSMREPPGMKTGQAMTDLRTIGTALEAYNVDQNQYPQAAGSDLSAGGIELANVERLEDQLKNYVRNVSATDPWGKPYLYWSSGNAYVLLSTGSDRMITDQATFQKVIQSIQSSRAFIKTTTNPCAEDEIIFSGQFLQVPNYASRECKK